MKDRGPLLILIFVVVLSLFAPFVHSGSIADSLMAKIKSQGKSDAVLELPSVLSSVLSNPAMTFLSGGAKTSMLKTLMKQLTSSAQAPFMSTISSLGFAEAAKPFWIANKVSIKNANLPLVQALSSLPGPFTLREPQEVKLIQSFPSDILNISKRQERAEWGVERIEAPAIWQTKTRGENVIVAGIDTGVLKDHDALRDNFFEGGWHDAFHMSDEPYDDSGHGTHTMGTMVGQYGIGVAPGAKWIACRGLKGVPGSYEPQLTECAQFVLDFSPTPSVVCNSWGTPGGNTYFNDEIAAWRAAGIIPVFALGNSGPNCNTAGSPGDQPNLISVGSTDSGEKIAGDSSKGYASGSWRIKPEVSAPGVNVLSAYHTGTSTYARLSGTSMAAPHVAGSVALMLSSNRFMKFDEIVRRLTRTAFKTQLTNSDLQCGAANGNWPNNVFGHGRINVRKAMA